MDSPQWFTEAVRRITADLADEDAPGLGVHAMSEFIYCPRAGIIAVDQRGEDSGCESETAPALGGLPMHDLPKLRHALEDSRELIRTCLAWNAALYLLTFISYLYFEWACLLAAPGLYFMGRWLWSLLKIRAILRHRLRQAESAAIQEPLWDLRQPQPIHWWSLIRSGFDSVEKQAVITDRNARIAGKPWRVLQKGSRHLPVLRIQVDAAADDPRRHGRLSPQQRARIAAYAYLIHRVERAQSDWVIVLFGKTDEGLAIPLDESMFSIFAEGLLAARKHLVEYQVNSQYAPPPPNNAAPCLRCPHAKPRHHKQHSVFRGVSVASLITEGTDGKRYHCLCGDRFRSVPPHEDAKRLGLVPR
jgi:hypothetical protein